MRKLALSALLFALVAPTFSMVGCNRITASSVRGNMTPELETVSLTPEQRKNRTARSVDHTLRQIHDDWDNLLLLDEPIKMTPYPIP